MASFLFADLVAVASPTLSPTLCAVGVVNLLTLVSAWFARLATGSRYERGCQAACLFLLATTGTLCGVSMHLGPGTAVTSAVTLTVATLIAVADSGETVGASDRSA
ncbi:MAG: hypothetical protein ISQ07_13830 [Pirellulales bacterium]|jgi:hypothetical protein|nr:hypothetical protein [Pirellulales bacterium]